MSHVEKCPICAGKGEESDGNVLKRTTKKCHGCGGKGWVTVID